MLVKIHWIAATGKAREMDLMVVHCDGRHDEAMKYHNQRWALY
jgi:hypothetical protein